MERPSVTAILPNYNYSDFFPSRLEEILTQTYPVSEVIILDDASTDNSVAVINRELKKQRKAHPDVEFLFIKNEKNSGNVFLQWRKGVIEASSELIWIAELDDSCVEDFLETAVAPFEKNKKAVLSYTGSKLVGDVKKRDKLRQKYDILRKKHLPGKYIASGKRELNKNLAIFNSIPNVSACVFKNIPELPKILGGAKNYKLCGDWFFYTKLAEKGKIAYSPEKLNLHRLSSDSVTSNTSLEDRYKEIKRVHSEAVLANDLRPSTLRKIEKLEKKLKRKWRLS
ncbi:glycosyltransferase [Candidatus Saccharibacteria bacterium]|nr:glycosyltransferase [Candidatus Saccharibacteria bacterium]